MAPEDIEDNDDIKIASTSRNASNRPIKKSRVSISNLLSNENELPDLNDLFSSQK